MGSCCSVDQEACSCPCDNTECKKKEERTSLINSHGDQFHCKWCLKHCPACKRCTENCEGPVCRRVSELEWESSKKERKLKEEFSKMERKLKDELSKEKEKVDDLSSKLFEIGTKTSFECRSDKVAPTVTARKFDDIFKQIWGDILDPITDRGIAEVEAMQLLCSLLKSCQTFCTEDAFQAISKSCQTFCTEDAFQAISKGWQMKSAKEKPRMSLEAYFESEEEKAIWAEYMKRCVECCWHMAQTDPPLVLCFPEPGDDHNKELFDDYTTQDDCYNESIPEGRVVCVAWPAVVQAQTKCKYAKGTVVLSAGKAPEIVERHTNTDQYQEVKWHYDQDSSQSIHGEHGQQSAGCPEIEPLQNTSQHKGQSEDSPDSPAFLKHLKDDLEQPLNDNPDMEQQQTFAQQKDQLKQEPNYEADPEQKEVEHAITKEQGDQPEGVPCDQLKEETHAKPCSGNLEIERHENTSMQEAQSEDSPDSPACLEHLQEEQEQQMNDNPDMEQQQTWAQRKDQLKQKPNYEADPEQMEVEHAITKEQGDQPEGVPCDQLKEETHAKPCSGNLEIERHENTSMQEVQSEDSPDSPACLEHLQEEHEQQMNDNLDMEQHQTIDQQNDKLKPDYQADPQ